MSVAALHTPHTNSFTIGASHSYCFYQELSINTSSLRPTKQIIPSIPRQHFKAPKNSSLSPIRKQKVMPKKVEEPLVRPLLFTTFSSPAAFSLKKRSRKVSFDEKVVVVCTVFDESDDDDNDDEEVEVPVIRRHSTGETNPKSILIWDAKSQPILSQKITKTLKQFKNRLLFVN
ncbi:hypothetical protein INT47_010843 [Mucor saturninus]|uniref:Uncharacterized protein n=1 Tax=Mucor saturninus TaxID=64648 RepID=A0A8H7R0T3_9FUNG|nr:hypothetical protein INT47_010843 [Mucor saturninus]